MTEPLNTPRDFVQSGWDYFRSLANDWIELSQQAIGDITNLDIVPIDFEDTALDLNVEYGDFVRPIKPDAPEVDEIDVEVPTLPTLIPVEMVDPGVAPVEPDFSGLVYNPPPEPTTAIPTVPSDIDPVLEEIEIPDMADYSLPLVPTLFELDLPDPPELDIPVFDSEHPTFDAEIPDSAFNWEEVAYSSTLMDSIKSHLSSMLDGGLGLPAEVEQALFDRGRSRADLLATKRVQERAEELAARGLVEPSAFLARRLDEARQEGRLETAGLNRDITIESAKISIENVKFALAQAGALEIALLQANGQINQRALEAAKISHDIQVAVFNALVSRFNAEVALFQADAEVFKQRIQAAIAQAELYKTQIEGQQAIGQLNESLIRSYSAQLESIRVLAEVYKTQVEAAQARGEINTQRLEQARIKVQTFGIEVDAWGKEQEGYKARVDAALGNVRVYEAIGNVYGRRVEAYQTVNQAYFQQAQFGLEKQRNTMAAYSAQLEGVKTLIGAQQARISAIAQVFSSEAGMYQAEGQVVAAESAAHDRTNELRVRVATARVDTALKNTEARINQNFQIYSLYVEQLKAKAQVVTQLSSATMAGVNFGASYNGSLSHSYSNSASLGWSGEAPDFNATYASFPLF